MGGKSCEIGRCVTTLVIECVDEFPDMTSSLSLYCNNVRDFSLKELCSSLMLALFLATKNVCEVLFRLTDG